MARQGSWDRKIWEDLGNLIKTDADGGTTIKVSFEDDPTDETVDPAELQRLAVQISLQTLKELKIMNLHLSHLSDQRFQPEDIGDQDDYDY